MSFGQRRPDYKKLGVLKQQFPEVPILALTATATDMVCQSIKDILRISACEFFRSSVDRPNLYWTVRKSHSSFRMLSRYGRYLLLITVYCILHADATYCILAKASHA